MVAFEILFLFFLGEFGKAFVYYRGWSTIRFTVIALSTTIAAVTTVTAISKFLF